MVERGALESLAAVVGMLTATSSSDNDTKDDNNTKEDTNEPGVGESPGGSKP